MSIFAGMFPHLWAVPDQVPTLAAPIVDIITYQALTTMKTNTLITQLPITMVFLIIDLLGSSVHRRSRITLVLVPLIELEPIWSSK